jgi:hypothetical protein
MSMQYSEVRHFQIKKKPCCIRRINDWKSWAYFLLANFCFEILEKWYFVRGDLNKSFVTKLCLYIPCRMILGMRLKSSSELYDGLNYSNFRSNGHVLPTAGDY